MKICYLADASSDHTKKWCDFFLKKGYEITVISLGYGEIEGVKVYNFSERNAKTRRDISKISYLTKLKKIREIVYSIKPDILHAHFATSYGLLGSLINYHPYIISMWGSDIYIFPRKGVIYKYLLKHNLFKADYIFSTSYDMAREASLYTNKEIEITPFGVDLEIFKPLNISKGDNKEIVVGIVKTLSEVYGIDYLIKAFKLLIDRNRGMEIKLKIAGKGEQEDYLKNLVKELDLLGKVEFLGYIDSQYKVSETFNTFDISVFPSLSESFGVAALESQACGVPVIVTNVGGFPEVIINGETGILVESKNEVQLSEEMERLVKNEELRLSMGIKGRKFVGKNYGIKNNFEKIDSLYHEIANFTHTN